MRIALRVEYDGSAFAGWQSQPQGNTVQDVLERAVGEIAAHPVRLSCAGRTDAGVHALAQVAHFDTAAVRPLSAWVRGVNATLPRAVAVREAYAVPDEFDARFSARARRYRYVLFNSPVRPAVLAGRVGWMHTPLDASPMQVAAQALLGEHDFSSFRSAQCQAKTPVKMMSEASVSRHGDFLVFEFCASAFLHHMIRNIVGALVQIGRGLQPPGWMAELLAARDRTRGAQTFDAAGLYFTGVEYEDRWQLPQKGRIIAPSSTLFF